MLAAKLCVMSDHLRLISVEPGEIATASSWSIDSLAVCCGLEPEKRFSHYVDRAPLWVAIS